MTIFTWLLFGLIIKHAYMDLYVQATREPSSKTNYLGGFRHYLDHGLGTAVVVMLCFGIDEWMIALALGVFDFFVHSMIDFSKANLMKKLGWTRDESRFWKIQAVDQALHYVTYMLIVMTAYNYYGAG